MQAVGPQGGRGLDDRGRACPSQLDPSREGRRGAARAIACISVLAFQNVSDLSAAEERAARDARIVTAAAKGEALADIAQREGIVQKTVRRALKRERDRHRRPERVVELDVPGVVEVDPFREVAEVLAAQRYAERELRSLAVRTGNDSAKTGALKASAQIARDRLSLLVEVGLCPPGVTWLKEEEWAAAHDALMAVGRDAGLDADELNAKLQERLDRPWGGETEVLVIGVGPVPDVTRAAA